MANHHTAFRQLSFNETITYRKALRSSKNRDAPEQPETQGPYTGKVVDFTETLIGVRADGWWGCAPLYYMDPQDTPY